MVTLGLERFLKTEYRKFKGQRLGVLCNPATNDKDLVHISQSVLKKNLKLDVVCFFGPQHGIRGEKQDNMIESEDFKDPVTGLPVYSLYSNTREPSERMLSGIDTLLIDLPDIGCRIYTFMYTMANCMRIARKCNKKVVILDRPNPINGIDVEGNLLEAGFTSFVGQYALPIRHGMTLGELALLFNEFFEIDCDLEVIECKGWKRGQYADSWSEHWVPPSPNIPTLIPAILFPGTVLFEGTNVSEGRGTTKPFEWIGAPYIAPDRLAMEMNQQKLPGIYFRPIFFQPTYQKWKDQVCGGVQLHITDRKKLKPALLGVRLLAKIVELYPADFKWKVPPYEYEHERMPIDLIAGTDKLRLSLDTKAGTKAWEASSKKDTQTFLKQRRKYLLYKK